MFFSGLRWFKPLSLKTQNYVGFGLFLVVEAPQTGQQVGCSAWLTSLIRLYRCLDRLHLRTVVTDVES